MLVVDASVVVAFLVDPVRREAIRAAFREGRDDLHAPAHLDLEVVSALRRLAASGALPDRQAGMAARDLADLPVLRHVLEPLMATVWKLRGNVSPYDAAYVALALALDAPLLTADAALARAPGMPVRIIQIPAPAEA